MSSEHGWLSHTDLEFGVDDFVAIFYPKSYKAEMYLACVRGIGADEILLQHWPANDSAAHQGHPYYQKPVGDVAWKESRRFWRLIRKVDPPQIVAGYEGVYSLGGSSAQLVHVQGKYYALT